METRHGSMDNDESFKRMLDILPDLRLEGNRAITRPKFWMRIVIENPSEGWSDMVTNATNAVLEGRLGYMSGESNRIRISYAIENNYIWNEQNARLLGNGVARLLGIKVTKDDISTSMVPNERLGPEEEWM